MDKFTYFKAAMKEGLYKTKAWPISAFSLIREDPNKWKEDAKPYRLVQTPTGHFYVDPDNLENLLPIDKADPTKPLFTFRESIDLKIGDICNLKKNITSTIGNFFFNYVVLAYSMNDKIEYKEGTVSIKDIEEEISLRLTDNIKPPAEKDNNKIYVDEYVKFSDALFYLTNFSQLCVIGSTEKTMTSPPGILEFKNSLLEKYKDRLHDPATIAIIDKALVDYDSAYLKGDPGESLLNKSKFRQIVRKKMFLMHGAEAQLTDKVSVDLIKNSLEQGWDLNKFPAMNNSLRAGSYNRGSATALGGESFKWLLRVSSNLAVAKDDCGTKLGKRLVVSEKNIKNLVGYNIVTTTGPRLISTKEEAGTYLGKTLLVRSPMYCKLDKTDFCKACLGTKLGEHTNSLSMAVSNYGSVMMYIEMSATHGKAITTAKMDYRTSLS